MLLNNHTMLRHNVCFVSRNFQDVPGWYCNLSLIQSILKDVYGSIDLNDNTFGKQLTVYIMSIGCLKNISNNIKN